MTLEIAIQKIRSLQPQNQNDKICDPAHVMMKCSVPQRGPVRLHDDVARALQRQGTASGRNRFGSSGPQVAVATQGFDLVPHHLMPSQTGSSRYDV